MAAIARCPEDLRRCARNFEDSRVGVRHESGIVKHVEIEDDRLRYMIRLAGCRAEHRCFVHRRFSQALLCHYRLANAYMEHMFHIG
jgi:hypothetical protein